MATFNSADRSAGRLCSTRNCFVLDMRRGSTEIRYGIPHDQYVISHTACHLKSAFCLCQFLFSHKNSRQNLLNGFHFIISSTQVMGLHCSLRSRSHDVTVKTPPQNGLHINEGVHTSKFHHSRCRIVKMGIKAKPWRPFSLSRQDNDPVWKTDCVRSCSFAISFYIKCRPLV